MDEFAQTGAQQDDLFDDIQYTPGAEGSMQTRAADDLFGEDFTPVQEAVAEQAPTLTPQRGRGGGGARGRGKGRERERNRGSVRDDRKPKEAPAPAPAPAPALSAVEDQSAANTTPAPTTPVVPLPVEASQTQPVATPTIAAVNPHTNAVRGDRTATGGLRKPKLTEEELSEKMNRISLKNASLVAAHERAEADAASFAEREQVAAQRRKEERRDRQQMMDEREKNRLRKLKATTGREWDSEKKEDDYAPRGGRSFGRGAHGGVAGPRDNGLNASVFAGDQDDYTDGREYMFREHRGRGRGKGRGGARGGRGGRGGLDTTEPRQQDAPAYHDFPDLPAAVSKSVEEPASSPAPTLSFPKKETKLQEEQVALGASGTSQGEANPETQPELTEEKSTGKSWAELMDAA